ncbi:hypothetical protein DLM45_12105 [Hyphomicrobium methylovorum]|uniref:Nif11-like leader peptide family natural product precursor n=1 Tax=Hyphomicrobium methylovorum TaxID=84 RepID=UPI0015E66B43|nr:Nif11-like leader peptide family natural product precursor [Hyphomicrobium methylovorum]MBA2126957.1 hypothetical protein [Hyphomicrobium methylovorum]
MRERKLRDIESGEYKKAIKKLGEAVMDDPALLERLDATPSKSDFIDLYCNLAKERDLSFSKSDLLIAVQEQKQGKDGIIPTIVLRMIADRF